ncbi:MAG: hypothetical protein ACREYE_13560 [Gammaproteobacteria bacterium]
MIYPATEGYYREIFGALLGSVVGTLGVERSRTYAVSERTTPEDLRRWLAQQPPSSVITLGRQAYEDYLATGSATRAVSGALDLSPQLDPRAQGVSLSIAPELFFDTLKKLAPKVGRVFVVYDPSKNQWIIDRARAVAGKYGLKITAFEAADLPAATQHYRAILDQIRPDKDALWIPLDSALLDEQAVLPVIIEQSWYRRLAVFSNSLVHARLGALFALYPDLEKLGARLAERALALDRNRHSAAPAIEPLRDVKRALNVHFARHLDVDPRRLSDEFDTYFPSPSPQ